jgi:hypothetical protein
LARLGIGADEPSSGQNAAAISLISSSVNRSSHQRRWTSVGFGPSPILRHQRQRKSRP